MEFKQVCMQRRSIRRYKPTPVSQKDLMDILEAGMYAPSAVDLQPWYFVVLQSEEHLCQLKEIMAMVSGSMRPVLQERFQRHPDVVTSTTSFLRDLGGAPVCILAFSYQQAYKKTASTITQSIAAAIENMLLSATDKGLGSCWLTAPLESGYAEVIQAKYAPDKGDLVALIALGYPDQVPKAPARKQGRYVIL